MSSDHDDLSPLERRNLENKQKHIDFIQQLGITENDNLPMCNLSFRSKNCLGSGKVRSKKVYPKLAEDELRQKLRERKNYKLIGNDRVCCCEEEKDMEKRSWDQDEIHCNTTNKIEDFEFNEVIDTIGEEYIPRDADNIDDYQTIKFNGGEKIEEVHKIINNKTVPNSLKVTIERNEVPFSKDYPDIITNPLCPVHGLNYNKLTARIKAKNGGKFKDHVKKLDSPHYCKSCGKIFRNIRRVKRHITSFHKLVKDSRKYTVKIRGPQDYTDSYQIRYSKKTNHKGTCIMDRVENVIKSDSISKYCFLRKNYKNGKKKCFFMCDKCFKVYEYRQPFFNHLVKCKDLQIDSIIYSSEHMFYDSSYCGDATYTSTLHDSNLNESDLQKEDSYSDITNSTSNILKSNGLCGLTNANSQPTSENVCTEKDNVCDICFKKFKYKLCYLKHHAKCQHSPLMNNLHENSNYSDGSKREVKPSSILKLPLNGSNGSKTVTKVDHPKKYLKLKYSKPKVGKYLCNFCSKIFCYHLPFVKHSKNCDANSKLTATDTSQSNVLNTTSDTIAGDSFSKTNKDQHNKTFVDSNAHSTGSKSTVASKTNSRKSNKCGPKKNIRTYKTTTTTVEPNKFLNSKKCNDKKVLSNMCSVCVRAYYSKSNLKRHLKDIHNI